MPRRKSAEGAPRPRPAILRPLGAQLRQLRLERNMSQERLAERAGLNYKYIGRIELAKSEPGADVLVRLARALAVPIGQLFETIIPRESRESIPYRLSPADIDALSTALSTVRAIVDRVAARQPRPSPTRAPRRSRR